MSGGGEARLGIHTQVLIAPDPFEQGPDDADSSPCRDHPTPEHVLVAIVVGLGLGRRLDRIPHLRTVLFDYIETFYNRRRHQARLGHRTPAEAYTASRAA